MKTKQKRSVQDFIKVGLPPSAAAKGLFPRFDEDNI